MQEVLTENMTYRIAICDDEPAHLENIRKQISEWGRLSGHGCEISAFSSAEEFFFQYEEDKAYDIMLLDVEMGEMSGIELARRIRQENSRAEIIFVTSHFEFIAEGYEVDALHYLVKPVSDDKLMTVLSKAAEKLSVEPASVVITCEGETVKLYEADILYVESFRHYISIYTKQGAMKKEYRMKENISVFQEKLSADFFRIHRSYLVSLKHIERISRTSVSVEGKIELPLARGKYDEVNMAFVRRN